MKLPDVRCECASPVPMDNKTHCIRCGLQLPRAATCAATLPPTRNHRQLAAWINSRRLVDAHGREVCARVERITTNTDRKLAGTRLRHVGRGRQGLVLEIWLNGGSIFDPNARLYRHESSGTYRRHGEAREWVEQNLRKAKTRTGR